MNNRIKIAAYVFVLLPCVSWFVKNPEWTPTHIFPVLIIAGTAVKLVIENKISKTTITRRYARLSFNNNTQKCRER